jgi:hypothetical protein
MGQISGLLGGKTHPRFLVSVSIEMHIQTEFSL